MRTHISLFSGIGGDTMAAEWAGFTTVQFVERDPFCQKVLSKHWEGVPIHDDITTYDPTNIGRVDLLTGGFPCQDISCAGKQAGLSGERSGLWFEMLRVIAQVRPAWVVAENVAALIGMGIDTCLSGLENEGYTTRTVVLPACGVYANHRRYRVFIIAHAEDEPGLQEDQASCAVRGKRNPRKAADSGSWRGNEFASAPDRKSELCDGGEAEPESESFPELRDRGCEIAPDATSVRCEPSQERERKGAKEKGWSNPPFSSGIVAFRQPVPEPAIRGVDDGVPGRAHRDRLRALGNAIVPQQIFPIFDAIRKEMDKCQ